jgi:energy-coupling factor transport system ATP-binding protein
VTFSYDENVTAVEGIDFVVNSGEMTALVGTNGAGKSTIAKLICGFEIPDRGRILINGIDVSDDSISLRAARVGYVMQNPNEMISKSLVSEEMLLGLDARGYGESEKVDKMRRALQVCGLVGRENWPISALSFGQKKRLTIATTLALEPGIIILDEPTAGQDLRSYTEIMQFLDRLNAAGTTVLLITHDMHLMLEYSRRALVFNEGKLIGDMSTWEALTDPEIVRAANLKTTSLYELAVKCKATDTGGFVSGMIRAIRGEPA